MINRITHDFGASWVTPFLEETAEWIVPLFPRSKKLNRNSILFYRKNCHDNH